MSDLNRRILLGRLALGAGGLAAAQTVPRTTHAGGYDVAPAPGLATVPRRPGEPVRFTFALDAAPAKATSGGWAREVTARSLPLAAGIAGAHLFLNPGGMREMHWHATADEWAYVLAGQCQVVVLDPAGDTEVANLGPGDLWYFPRGHAHSIQTLGAAPCHAVLAFNDGLYSDHGTFGISDWLSQSDPALLAQVFGVPAAVFAACPQGETYIVQGPVVAADGPEAAEASPFPPERSHRHAVMERPAYRTLPGGTLHVASATAFPRSGAMTAAVTRLQPGAVHELHWHPNASEWHYLARGRTRVTLFGADKHLAVADLQAGDCAYIPQGWGHSVQNTGAEPCEVVGVLDAGAYQESSLTEWVAGVPPHVLASTLSLPGDVLDAFPRYKVDIAAPR